MGQFPKPTFWTIFAPMLVGAGGFSISIACDNFIVERPSVGSEEFAEVAFDHAKFTNNCAQCHEAERPDRDSHPRTGDCEACHTYPKWAVGATGGGASFTHLPKPETCGSCHEVDRPKETYSRAYPNQGPPANFDTTDTKAPGSGHLLGKDCVACHKTPAEGASAYVFDHSSPPATFCLPCHYDEGFAEHGTSGPAYVLEGFGNCNSCHVKFDKNTNRSWKFN